MNEIDRLTRWRMVLGGEEADGIEMGLSGKLSMIDSALQELFDADSAGQAGLGSSSPKVKRWLKNIRSCFPPKVVQVLQKEAIERHDLKHLLFEPEVLNNITPDVNLLATLLELKHFISEENKDTARQVVKKVVEELLSRLEQPTRSAIQGALNRSTRNRKPKYNEIDWNRTIRQNLKYYQPDYQTIIPEVRIGFGRKKNALRDVILCIDQSGSMSSSVIYSGIFGCVLASLPAIRARMVVFDTAVVDLTEELQDPVDLLFGIQLGGGTDIHKALGYCQQLITRPQDTILLLITDLYEGGNNNQMLKKAQQIIHSGVNFIVLLALNDEGAPIYDKINAKILNEMNVPVFACSPDLFPDMMSVAIAKGDLHLWASQNNLTI